MRSGLLAGRVSRSSASSAFPRRCAAERSAALLAAIDGAEGGRRKLPALGRGLPLVCVLTAAEIGAAFGREHGVNASLGSGALCRRFLADAQKLAGFRANAVVEQAPKSVPAAPARQDDGIGVK